MSVPESKNTPPKCFTVRRRGWRYTAHACFWEDRPGAKLASQPPELCRDDTHHCSISVHARSPAALFIKSDVSLESQTSILSWWETNEILVSCYSLPLNKRIKAFSISVAVCQLPGAVYCYSKNSIWTSSCSYSVPDKTSAVYLPYCSLRPILLCKPHRQVKSIRGEVNIVNLEVSDDYSL